MSLSLPNSDTIRTAGSGGIPEYQTPTSLPMYIAGFMVTICGLLAVNVVLEDPSFSHLTILLTLIGFLVSYLARQQGIAPQTLELPAAICFAGVCIVTLLGDQSMPLLSPGSANDDRAKGLAALLTWLVVLRSFTLTTNARLVFCSIPTIAITGLVSTMSTEPVLLTYFLVFLGSALFMVVHENYLRSRGNDTTILRPSIRRAMLSGQVQMAILCLIGAVLLANFVAPPLRAIGSQLILANAIPMQQRQSSTSTPTRIVQFSESQEYRVSTGPVKLSDQIVMRVRAEHGSYWRGTTFDQYTGRSWINTLDSDFIIRPAETPGETSNPLNDQQTDLNLPVFRVPETLLMQVDGPAHTLRQVVRLEAGLFNEIYAAPEPRQVRMTQPSVRMDASGTIHLPRATQNSIYEVVSEIIDWTPERLRATGEDYPESIRSRYTQLPTSNPAAINQIRQTASRLTRDLNNPYDKVMALQNWISQQCKYNTEAPAAPTDQDVVAHFLFTQKQGYCDIFATSLAIMCRTIGIPARVASGFLPGELDPQRQDYLVRERDKHQWTEVYFAGVGWISFDATTDAEDISPQSDSRGKNRLSFLGLLFQRGLLPPLALLVFVLLMIYVIKVELLDRLRPRRKAVFLPELPATNYAIVEAYEAVCGLLAKKGLPRLPSETPDEYYQTLAGHLTDWPDLIGQLQRLTALLVRYRYGRKTATEEEVRQAEEIREAIRLALKSAGRRPLKLLPSPVPGEV